MFNNQEKQIESLKIQIDELRENNCHKVADLLCYDLKNCKRKLYDYYQQ